MVRKSNDQYELDAILEWHLFEIKNLTHKFKCPNCGENSPTIINGLISNCRACESR